MLHNIIGAAYSVYNIMLYPFLNYDKYFIETEKEELKKKCKNSNVIKENNYKSYIKDIVKSDVAFSLI